MSYLHYCLDQAASCQDFATAAAEPELAAEWRQMAEDWLQAAQQEAANDGEREAVATRAARRRSSYQMRGSRG
jgi:hypothetical protein